jgi:hypothetical protein
MSRRLRVRDRLMDWAWDHPRAKKRLREAWGLSREGARALHLQPPFEPPELADLRKLRDTATARGPRPSARVLVLSMRGWSTHVVYETVLAHALQRRGAEVVFSTCGGRLPVCDVAPVHVAPPMPCHSCREYATSAIGSAGFSAITLRELVDVRARAAAARARVGRLKSIGDCEAYTLHDLPVGRLVRISVAWFLSRGTLPDTPEALRAYRTFLVSGSVVLEAFERLLERVEPDRIFLLNGSFFAERILLELARRRGISVTTYEKGFMIDTVVVAQDGFASDLLVDEAAWQEASTRPLDVAESQQIAAYLEERRSGGRTLANFWRDRVDEERLVRTELNLLPGRPVIAMFCNITWDSAVQGKDIAYRSMGDWVVDVIGWAREHQEADLVIRVHPAEVKLTNHPTLERMCEHINANAHPLPENVRIVPPESSLSSYTLMELASVGMVYTSTVGIEMAVMGIPVIVAAETHYRGRGFTLDVASADECRQTLDRALAASLDATERARISEVARRYAYLFFFRFHQATRAVHETGRSRPRLGVATAAELDRGRDEAIDRIVDGILTGKPVVTPIPLFHGAIDGSAPATRAATECRGA